jgi:ATP-dependent Lon protease
MVTNYEGDNIELKDHLPLLPIRDIVVYPFMILPFFVMMSVRKNGRIMYTMKKMKRAFPTIRF